MAISTVTTITVESRVHTAHKRQKFILPTIEYRSLVEVLPDRWMSKFSSAVALSSTRPLPDLLFLLVSQGE